MKCIYMQSDSWKVVEKQCCQSLAPRSAVSSSAMYGSISSWDFFPTRKTELDEQSEKLLYLEERITCN